MATMTESRHPLIDRLFAEAERRILSAGEVAVQLGVSPSTVFRWKNAGGGAPQPRHQRAIIAWLKNDPDAPKE